MTFVKSGADWLRHNVGWSNTWASWRERLFGLAYLLAAGALVYLGATRLAFWQSAVLWLVFGVALAVGSRLGWFNLFGPVLLYDMIRTARRSRYSIIRIVFGGFLLFILLTSWFSFMMRANQAGMERREMAVFAEGFFLTLILVQLVMVVLLTPAYVAGAISEEKDRKTLEFLLATDLNNREIILSKFLSRAANMTLLLLTGLPILSILQFAGGVDPELMIAGFIGVGLTMLGIASMSMLLSTLLKRPRDSISASYLLIIAYLSIFTFSMGLKPMPMMNKPIWFGEFGPTLNQICDVANWGNPIAAIATIGQAIGGRMMGGRGTLAAVLPGVLENYAWFHLSVTLICLTWCILRLRAVALKQTAGGKTAKLRWWQRYRPTVGSFPMLWKEFYIEGGPKTSWLAGLALGVLILATIGIGVWLLEDYLWGGVIGFRSQREFIETMNIWFRCAGTGVGSLSLLMLAVRASTTITSEKERDTFDSLVTTPLSAENMLLAKLLGCLAGMRSVWIWLGSMMVLALLTGGLHPLAVPLFISAWFIYALFVTMVGMGYSMVCKSSIWSSLFTVLTTLFVCGGHWLVTSCCCMPVVGLTLQLFHQRGPDRFMEETGRFFMEFQAGMTPSVVLALGSFSWQDLERLMNQREMREILIFGVIGLPMWAMGCGIMWFAILMPTFRTMTRRVEFIHDRISERTPYPTKARMAPREP